MSHYTQIETQFRDEECLVKALSDIGYPEVDRGEKLPLYDWGGNPRPETAEVVVRRKNITGPKGELASNDIGFARQADGTYTAIVSEYDQTPGFGFEWQTTRGRLLQRYAYHRAVKSAHAQGFAVTGQVTKPDGTVHLTLKRRPGAVRITVGR